ncbi:MAG: FtsX-like permease family protein, partial [Raoultibacter sp.]
TIKGFFEDPQMGTPFMEIKRACIATSAFADLEKIACDLAVEQGESAESFYGNLNMLRLVEANINLSEEAKAAGLDSQDLTRIISENTTWGATTSGMFSATTLTGYAMLVIIIGSAIMGVFALLLFIVALVICVHAISTSIEENYADYGTLKALGIPHRTLSQILVIEYSGVSFIGLCVGLALSSVLTPLALPFFAQLTGVLAVHKGITPLALGCIIVLAILVVGATTLKARKLSRISPLRAFRGGSTEVHFTSLLMRPVTGKLLELQLALRALISAKRRYIGLLTCAIFLCSFIVLVFGVGGSLGSQGSALDTFGMWRSDVSVCLKSDDITKEEVEQVITKHASITRSWQEVFTMVNLGGESRSFVGLSDLDLIEKVSEGRAPKLDNEAIIGPNLARSLGLTIGDEFVITVDGSPRTLIITGIISAMFNAGYGTILTYDGFCEAFNKDPLDPAVGYQYSLENPNDAEEVRQALEAEFGEAIDARPSGLFSDTTDMVELIQTLFISLAYGMTVVAAMLAFLAVSLITGRMFSAERHDLGVYRALGFTSRTLRLQFALRFFLVSFAGCALGASLTLLGGGWLVSQLFGMFGITHFELEVTPIIVSILTVGFAVVFFAAAYFSARAIKRINVRELVVE